MKIFILYAKENWITDQLYKEWMINNRNLYTNNIDNCDIKYMIKKCKEHNTESALIYKELAIKLL